MNNYLCVYVSIETRSKHDKLPMNNLEWLFSFVFLVLLLCAYCSVGVSILVSISVFGHMSQLDSFCYSNAMSFWQHQISKYQSLFMMIISAALSLPLFVSLSAHIVPMMCHINSCYRTFSFGHRNTHAHTFHILQSIFFVGGAEMRLLLSWQWETSDRNVARMS